MSNSATKQDAPFSAITHRRRLDRSIDELIGISRGILADGSLVQAEAEFLLSWMDKHREFANAYPYNLLYPRIVEMLSDGELDAEEEGELIGMLLDLQGGVHDYDQGVSNSSTLPLCKPAPDVEFSDCNFVMTGCFASGTRKEITSEVLARGGLVKGSPSKKTRYLVIGDVGSRDWLHSSFGRKIEKAMQLRDQGTGLRIVSEQHWLTFLD